MESHLSTGQGCWKTQPLLSLVFTLIQDRALLPLLTHEASMLLLPASLPLQSRTMYWSKGGTLGDRGKAHASGSYTDKLSNTKGHGPFSQPRLRFWGDPLSLCVCWLLSLCLQQLCRQPIR